MAELISRMRQYGATIFQQMTQLAVQHDAVNLGQGFPDVDPHEVLIEAAHRAMLNGHNQYAAPLGELVLREAVAQHQQEWYGLEYDPGTEVLITPGATGGIAMAMLSLCEPGDEVIVFEPFYDSYQATISLAGAVQKTVQLEAPRFAPDAAAIEAQVTDRTKLIVLTNPHNPTGRVYDAVELEQIAQVARRHNLVVLSDEVYEHLVFDGRSHTPIASLPGMRERTITLSSGGKTFDATGWKIGWATGPGDLINAMLRVQQFVTYSVATPLQHALAVGLTQPRAFFERITESFETRRDLLRAGLESAGIETLASEGSYFVLTDIGALSDGDGQRFCRELPEKIGVAAIPVTAFTLDDERLRPFVRFAFCRKESVVKEGCRRLLALGE